MSSITTRQTTGTGASVKGSPLSNAEIDTNFINLNDDKLEITDTTDANTANKVVKRDSSGSFDAQDITLAGTLSAPTVTATSIIETSSITLKENISPIGEGLKSILSLNGVVYDRKDGTKQNEAGLIAEDVIKVLPNLVTLNSSGNPEGINYTKITAYLIEAIKELKAELDTLKGK